MYIDNFTRMGRQGGARLSLGEMVGGGGGQNVRSVSISYVSL